MPVTLRLFAAARAAAGASSAQVSPGPLADVLTALQIDRPQRLGQVLTLCSFICDGRRLEQGDAVPDGAVVDVLPPYAGG